MPRHVFVSYSSQDRALADEWCHVVEGASLPCWIAPRDILPSADWAEQIIDGIDAAWTLLLLLTVASNQSQQVRREVERAVYKKIPVLPLRINNVALSKSLEYFLSAQHWFDAFEGASADHHAGVVNALLALRRKETRIDSSQPPAPVAWSRATLAPIEQRLALYVGPVAAVLVQRAARQARDEAQLIELLAREVDDPRARENFIAAIRSG
jgi:hypothetical protein